MIAASAVPTLIAVVVPTVLVAVLGLDSVQTVADVGAIPSGLPPLALPHLSDLTVGVITGAFAIAAIALVQGAGVSEAAPNPDGSPSRMNRDFIGQGVANLASGIFHGTPVGGSVSSTALNVTAGARSRWASIFAGVWMLLILLALARVVALVPMPTLAAVLIFAAVMSLRFGDIGVVWKTSYTGKIGMVVTFLSTLALPVAAAVGVGVICSLLLQLNKSQMDLRIVRLGQREDGMFVEQPVPTVLPDAEPVVLDVYGSLLYAGERRYPFESAEMKISPVPLHSRDAHCQDMSGVVTRWRLREVHHGSNQEARAYQQREGEGRLDHRYRAQEPAFPASHTTFRSGAFDHLHWVVPRGADRGYEPGQNGGQECRAESPG